MYAPPEIIQTEIFARLPDKFRRKDPDNPWVIVNRRGLPADSFLEGPSFDRNGQLYIVDIPYGRIFRISPAGEFTLVAEGCAAPGAGSPDVTSPSTSAVVVGDDDARKLLRCIEDCLFFGLKVGGEG